MDDALADMAERVGSKNFTFVITAVTIQRQIGGSLAGLFDMVAETVRQRQQFARKVKGLTAMGRMSAYVLVGLPFFLAARDQPDEPGLHVAAVAHRRRPQDGLRRPVHDHHRKPDAQEDRVLQGVMMMLLLITLLFVAAATFAVAEVATYPARLKERSIRRAAEYGRVRVPDKADDLLRFRERVLAPAAERLAAIPLQAQPAPERRDDHRAAARRGPVAARHARGRSSPIKGGATVGGALLGC